MKKYIIILFVMLTASQAFAKKDKKDAKDLKIDSLMKANDSLRVHFDSLTGVHTMRYDSVSQELKNIYIIIKEKVVKKDFNEANLPHTIDSLISLRDSSFSKYHANASTLMDSLVMLKNDNVRMKSMLNGIMADETAKNRIVYELKQLKELLNDKIITQAEFDALKAKLLAKW